MLSNVAIKAAVNDLLNRATGYKVYGREVTEGYDTPSLFTEKLTKPFQRETVGFAKSGFTIMITFFQDTPDELEQMKLLDTVRDAFGMSIAVEDRILTVGEITYDYAGQKEDILQISVDFDFYENTTPKEAGEIAKEAEIRTIYKEE